MNKSSAQNMYDILPKDKGGKELYYHKVKTDFSDKQHLEYVPPPFKENPVKKNTYVHNCIYNKNRSNIEYIDSN